MLSHSWIIQHDKNCHCLLLLPTSGQFLKLLQGQIGVALPVQYSEALAEI